MNQHEQRLQYVEILLGPRSEEIVHLHIDDGDPHPAKAWTSEPAGVRDAKGRRIIFHHPIRDDSAAP